MTGKEGGNATLLKNTNRGPIRYQVCGTCPAPSVCFDDVGDPIDFVAETVRVTVSNWGIGKAKEKVNAKELIYKYKEQGSGDLKKGVPSYVKIEIFDEVGDLESTLSCDPMTIKNSKLDVNFNISKLEGKGKATIDFVTDILASCGIDGGLFSKILNLCSAGEKGSLEVSKDGDKLEINIKKGKVTGLDLDPL